MRVEDDSFEVLRRPVARPAAAEPLERSRTAYLLLGLALGFTGLHNFYAQRTRVAVVEASAFFGSMAILGALVRFEVEVSGPLVFLMVPLVALPGVVWMWAAIEALFNPWDGQGLRMEWDA